MNMETQMLRQQNELTGKIVQETLVVIHTHVWGVDMIGKNLTTFDIFVTAINTNTIHKRRVVL